MGSQPNTSFSNHNCCSWCIWHPQSKVLSALFHIQELTDTRNWLVSLWLAEKHEAMPFHPPWKHGQFCSLCFWPQLWQCLEIFVLFFLLLNQPSSHFTNYLLNEISEMKNLSIKILPFLMSYLQLNFHKCMWLDKLQRIFYESWKAELTHV